METITSKENQLVKYTRRLLTRRGRDREGKFILEGLRLVKEALLRPELVEYVFISRGLEHQHELRSLLERVRCYQVSEQVMRAVADTHTPSGILVVCSKPVHDPEELAGAHGFFLVIDKVRDPGNLGTILRTAWAAAVDAVLLVKGTADVYNPKVVRSSMGAVLNLPVFEKIGPGDILELNRRGYRFILADPAGSRLFNQVDYRGDVALVVGSETAGLSELFGTVQACNVRIPLRPGVDSLNAAVACGIILYTAWQQRNVVDDGAGML